ncbi:hypothetical protein SNE510_23160 [Streptomyces sp. NE5-10]|uniref:FG-GAP repeat domain-containing protein n=1 Tax=Streptomyces sp. NE5-10 TaxID=2759674 RepID=UPI001A624D2B|nr:VCBS repeat-containing protein [Streptomyces sp. NE5-10]GHJ92797.1 hypothetical protein SNE510_23160 [Streptomyces sp. NE5-10]
MHSTYTRPRARRLAAAAVTVALAATGGTLSALPAAAAPAAPVAPAAAQDARQTGVAFPRDADVVGAGPSGFLSKTRGSAPVFRWTRYADGTSTVLPGASAAGGGTDLVVTGDRAMLTVSSVLTAAGNLGGAKTGDLLARDRDGVLWLYLGKGDGTFAGRKRVGGGWGAFKGLTAVGDANGDGRADLVAWNGDETFYAGTGDWSAPFKRGARASLTQDSAYDSLF